jgi:hypothetical protein
VRQISIEEFPPETPRRAPDECGPAPQQMWLPIAQLVVDPRYQREITKQGRSNVRRIAASFHWKYFSAVVVAPVPGGQYAIVDGQHRSTAAALCGHPAVPCQVIFADVNEQAQAFSAINGAVTRVHNLAMHKAAVAAGDKDALAIEKAAAAAGVQVLRFPVSELNQLPGQTMAIGAIRDCLREFGREAVVLGLRGVTETSNAVKGGLNATIVRAIVTVAGLWLVQGRNPVAFITALGGIVLIREADKAARAERPKGQSIAAALAERLRARLELNTAPPKPPALIRPRAMT